MLFRSGVVVWCDCISIGCIPRAHVAVKWRVSVLSHSGWCWLGCLHVSYVLFLLEEVTGCSWTDVLLLCLFEDLAGGKRLRFGVKFGLLDRRFLTWGV